MRKLYHFTSTYHLPLILNSGFLDLTESNLKQDEIGYKPVVWLTRNDTPHGHGLEGCSLNKHEVRITINEQEHYENWHIWSRNNRIKTSWAKRLERGYNSTSWYVSESIIPLNIDNLLKIENTITGEILIDVTADVTKCQLEVTKPAKMPSSIFQEDYGNTGIEIGDIINFSVLNV